MMRSACMSVYGDTGERTGKKMTKQQREQELAAADDRTLRLAAPDLTAAKLQAFLRYQRAVAARLAQEADLATAHRDALAECSLDRGDFSKVEALCRAFCVKRLGHRELIRKREDLRARPVRDVSDDSEEKLSDAIRAREGDVAALERRYGKDAVSLLLDHEQELLALHETLSRAARK
jgi:hypothetical protein